MEPRADLSALLRAFVPPPGLGRARPREVRLTPGGEAVVVVAAMLFVIAVASFVLLSSVSARQAAEQRDLMQSGVDTPAQVVRLWHASDKSHQPMVAYRFDAGVRTYQGESRIGLTSWKSLAVGSAIAIRYWPADPRISVLAGRERRALPFWVPIVVSIALACGGALCLVWLRRERRLLRDGRAAPAVVTQVEKHHTQHGGTFRTIAYNFALLSGATAVGKSQAARTPPEVGSVICVVYDPDQPARNAPYPMKLVRLAS